MSDSETALASVRSLLPAWTAWLSLGFPLAAFALSAAAAWCAGRLTIGAVRKHRDAHWMERARAAHPHRQIAGIMTLFPVLMLAMLSARISGPLSATPPALLFTLTAVAAYLGSFCARRGFAHEIQARETSWSRDLRLELISLALAAPHIFALFAMNAVVQPVPGPGSWLALGLGALAFALACWAGGLPILRRIGVARPAEARLQAIVADVAAQAKIEPRAVYVCPWPGANAFAFPVSQQLVFTEDAVSALDDEDLAAITSHELGHLTEPRSALIARLAGVFALLPFGFVTPITHSWGSGATIALLASYYGVVFVVMRLSRGLEQRADALAHACEARPGDYARALERLYETNLAPVVTGSSNPSHPELYDRLLAAGVEPDYPRPATPSRLRLALGAVGAAIWLGAGTVVLLSPAGWVERLAPPPLHATLTVTLTGGQDGLLDLAVEHVMASSPDAVPLLRAVATARPRGHHASAYLATTLATAGDCGGATDALSEAETRAGPDTREGCGWIEQARGAIDVCVRGDAASIADASGP